MATNNGGAWRQWTSAQVAEWLVGAGFAQYAEVFQSNDIAGDILPELTNEVLRDDLGIAAFGHRARLLHAAKALMEGSVASVDTPAAPLSPAATPPASAKSQLDLAVLHAAPLVIRDGKRLYAMEKLDLEAERRAITNSLLHDIRDKAIHVQFEVATADVLRRVMTASTCRVLHFSGHGLGTKPALCFEDGLGCTHLVTPEILRDLTFTGSVGASQTQLVFVNSCHSQNVAKVFLEAGIPHVVAVHSDSLVVDASATMFAKHFYLSLFSGHTVQAAFNVARAFVRTLPSPTRGVCCCAHLHEPDCKWRQAGSRHSNHSLTQCCCKGDILSFPHDESSKFLLLGGDGSETAHEVVLFGNIPPGKLIDHTVQAKAIIPSLHGQFIGRGIETYMLVKSLRDNAVTACIGAPGIGKSSLVISVAHFAHSRRMFSDGVYYVDLEGQKLSTVRYSIAQAMSIAASETDEEVFAEIGSRQCLLILDKAEELLDEDELKAQQFFTRIVALAPRLRLLLGSRRIPHIPNVTCYSLSLQQLPTRLAVDLLCLMAPSCPAAAAERLAKLCGCLPLAIRIVGRALANARSTVTPEQMIEHLEGDESRLETIKELNQVGQRECVDRCIRSSFAHLDEPLQLAFMALGLFRGSFDAAAVEAVLDTLPNSKALTARSIAHSSTSSTSSTRSSFATRGLFGRPSVIEDDLESTTGLGTKLAEADGFTHENDGVFTREAYDLLDFESPEEALARAVPVATTANALKLLHQWSLVEYDAGAKRYRMHNLIQLFAEEEATRLGESLSQDGDSFSAAGVQGLGREVVLTWRRRFIRHYCVVVANASHSYRYDGDLSLFDNERANIESAIRIGRLLTLQSIDRMRDLRRQAEDERLEREIEKPGFTAGENSPETISSRAKNGELFDKSALVDVLIYCNLVTRSRFIFRTRIEPKRRLEFLSSCLQMAHETRSLYCTCGCSENDPANLLWDIDDVKYDRPLGMLDTMPLFDEPVMPTATQLNCSCPGIKELIGLEILLLIDLGYASCDAADWIAAEYYYLEVFRLQRDVLGWGENGQVAEVLNQFGICLSSGWGCMAYNVWLLRHAERLLLAGLKVRGRVLGENHPDYATSLNNVANFYKNANPNKKKTPPPHRKYSDAKKQSDGQLETASSTGTDSWATMSTTSSVSDEPRSPTNPLTDVEGLYRRSLRIREATLGQNHPMVAQSLNNLALALIAKIQPTQMKDPKNKAVLREVDGLYARALQIRRAALGNSSFETAATLNNIGNLRRLTGDWETADRYIHEALRVINRFDSDHSPRAARMYINLARLERDQKRYDEAIKAYEIARDIRQKWFPGSRDVGYCIEQIGKCMKLKGSDEEGVSLEAEGRRMKKLGIASFPDSTSRSPRNEMSTETSPFSCVRLRVVDVIPQEVILLHNFNFPGRLLGRQGMHMKRIDAITCATVRYRGPWPSDLKFKRSRDNVRFASRAEIQITAATDLAVERAKDQCIALLRDVEAQYHAFIAKQTNSSKSDAGPVSSIGA